MNVLIEQQESVDKSYLRHGIKIVILRPVGPKPAYWQAGISTMLDSSPSLRSGSGWTVMILPTKIELVKRRYYQNKG